MEKHNYIQPFSGPLSGFPFDDELPDGVKTVEFTDRKVRGVSLIKDVVYAERDGQPLHMNIYVPVQDGCDAFPCAAYVPGSAWHKQDIAASLAMMVAMCQRGYVMAAVEYRPSEVAPFPAQMQDAKTAVRYLRKNAAQYHIKPDNIAVWGDSSGGHTALMVGFTGDGEPDTPLYGDVSAKVSCIVDWYGPTDISAMNDYPSAMDHVAPDSPEGYLIGRRNVLENPDAARATMPAEYLSADRPTPPLLIMHGNRDQLVAFNQSCRLYEKMRTLGKSVEMYRLQGGYHGFCGFNSDAALDIVDDFLKKYI